LLRENYGGAYIQGKNSVTHRAPEAMARRRRHVTQKAAGMLAESRQQAARKPRESCQQAE